MGYLAHIGRLGSLRGTFFLASFWDLQIHKLVKFNAVTLPGDLVSALLSSTLNLSGVRKGIERTHDCGG